MCESIIASQCLRVLVIGETRVRMGNCEIWLNHGARLEICYSYCMSDVVFLVKLKRS